MIMSFRITLQTSLRKPPMLISMETRKLKLRDESVMNAPKPKSYSPQVLAPILIYPLFVTMKIFLFLLPEQDLKDSAKRNSMQLSNPSKKY